MGKPRVIPIPENRRRALDYWIRYCRSDHVVSGSKLRQEKERAILQASMAQADPVTREVETAIAASTLGGYGLADAVDQLIAREPEGWQNLTQALAIGYMGSEFRRHRREITPQLYCSSSIDDLYYIAFHAALAGLGFWQQADTLCRHLMNLWLARGIDKGLDDQDDFLSFYWHLMRAQYKKEWPKANELDAKDLGEFYPLFTTVMKPSLFESALVNYGDFRLARMHEYPSQHATRRYPEIHNDALTYGPLLLFPAELLAFKAIYERTTGQTCTLSATHPVLNEILMNPPKNLPLPENEYSRKVDKVGRSLFGEKWKLHDLVQVRFDNPPSL